MRRVLLAVAAVALALTTGGDAADPGVPMSRAAHDYLAYALDVLQDRALDSAEVDWREVRTDAFATARGAREPEDTYAAIRGVIAALGNPHTGLVPPGGAVAPPAAEIPVPGGELLAGRFALLTIPGIEHDPAGGRRYVTAGQAAVTALDAAAPCGWLVDLRSNNGGDMWPMVTVLAPLLGLGRLGSFVEPDGKTIRWEIRDGAVLLDGEEVGTNAVRLTRPAPPVAVLVSPRTASSGEGTLVSFLGLDRARTFGTPTAGLSTANETVELADGAVMADRTGHRYGTAIAPDTWVSTHDGADVTSATAWLAARPECA